MLCSSRDRVHHLSARRIQPKKKFINKLRPFFCSISFDCWSRIVSCLIVNQQDIRNNLIPVHQNKKEAIIIPPKNPQRVINSNQWEGNNWMFGIYTTINSEKWNEWMIKFFVFSAPPIINKQPTESHREKKKDFPWWHLHIIWYTIDWRT